MSRRWHAPKSCRDSRRRLGFDSVAISQIDCIMAFSCVCVGCVNSNLAEAFTNDVGAFGPTCVEEAHPMQRSNRQEKFTC